MWNREQWREWYEGSYLNTDHWHKVKQVVYADATGAGVSGATSTTSTTVHHLHYFSLWHELDDPTSVTGVCADCHKFLRAGLPTILRRGGGT